MYWLLNEGPQPLLKSTNSKAIPLKGLQVALTVDSLEYRHFPPAHSESSVQPDATTGDLSIQFGSPQEHQTEYHQDSHS